MYNCMYVSAYRTVVELWVDGGIIMQFQFYLFIHNCICMCNIILINLLHLTGILVYNFSVYL